MSSAAGEERPASGAFDGEWYFEEQGGVSRLGLRVRRQLHQERSPYQKIDLYETEGFGLLLTLDDLVMFTERDEFVYHEMLVHVPLLSHPQPRDVLVIGGGDCGCVREILRHECVERVVQCEIDERVTRVCNEYFDWSRQAAADPRAELVFADGVEYIAQNHSSFDLIVVDSTDPIGPAVGLFQAEFFEKVKAALRPGGILTAQTESPHWHAGLVGEVQGELRKVFQNVSLYLGQIPTYPSGTWSWSYASESRRHDEFFDEVRAAKIESQTGYYNAQLHRACFALPNFVRDVLRQNSQ